MSTIINIVVDITLSASWWIIKKTSYGIYSGTYYLIWGKTETEKEKRDKEIDIKLENIENILLQHNNKQKINNDEYNNDINDYNELPPSYIDVIKEDTEFEIV